MPILLNEENRAASTPPINRITGAFVDHGEFSNIDGRAESAELIQKH